MQPPPKPQQPQQPPVPQPLSVEAPPAPPPPDPAADLERDLRRATRRGFAVAGVAALAGVGGWRWLATRSGASGIVWPLRDVLRVNERLARLTFDAARLAPGFARSLARDPRVNGTIGLGGAEPGVDPLAWRLHVRGGPDGQARRVLTLADVRALPRFEQTTELKCIEGWSTVVHWAGVRLADLAATTGLARRSGRPYAAGDPPPGDLYDYVGLATPDAAYYVGLDAPSALHPQTLLCYEMNGQPLTPRHGAPLRLAIPVKYGIKNIKRVGSITFSDRRPADYWAELGYDWFAGH